MYYGLLIISIDNNLTLFNMINIGYNLKFFSIINIDDN